MDTNKKKGSFYTPEDLAEWVAEYITPYAENKKKLNALEAGCGDGAFLRALDKCKLATKLEVIAIDSDKAAINKAKADKYRLKTQIIHDDFLSYTPSVQFDIVIGNPPYVIKKRLSEKQAKLCRKIHKEAGLLDREVANLWTAFVVKSVSNLKKNGIAAFILPTEILQVKYAEEIRKFLAAKFASLEVITFRKLAFSKIDQDTVILICSNATKDRGIFVTEVESIDELRNDMHHKPLNIFAKKWTGNTLSNDELNLLYKISNQFKSVNDYCSSVAGIVTAANSFFIVNDETVENYDLRKFVKPIIQKGMHVNGAVQFSNKDFEKLVKTNTPCWLLDLNTVPQKDFPSGLRRYLKEGVKEGLPDRYKCLQRERWFDVPSIWHSEGFFFKRCHQYPKLLINSANVHVTDSAYRIKMKEGFNIESLTQSFYNSLTLAMAELHGRFYGGGVLELTPNEFKSIPLPYKEIDEQNNAQFIKDFKNKENIKALLETNDKILLEQHLKLAASDILMLQTAYEKLRKRRMRTQ